MEMFPIILDYEVINNTRVVASNLRKLRSYAIVVALPWEMILPHEKQALENHGQTLRRLADRGGLGTAEVLAILEDRKFAKMNLYEANGLLFDRITTFIHDQFTNCSLTDKMARRNMEDNVRD